MDYVALNVAVSDESQAEILIAGLSDFPFDGFEVGRDGLEAWIPADLLADCKAGIDDLLARRGVSGRYATVADRDWNAAWERTFTPVDVAGRLRLRAPFHEPAPEGVLEIVLTPRMAFGSGHHVITCLMAAALLDSDVRGRRGLDVGSGTGVLAILAAKCGAAHVDAVDIDRWADANCRENAAANGVADRIETILGEVGRIAGRTYDFVLANINRNVLLGDMPAYAAALYPGGELMMSGFLTGDVPAVAARAEASGMRVRATGERDGWAIVRCLRP